MLVSQVYGWFGQGSCFFDCCFYNVCVCFVVLYFTVIFEFLLFLCNGIFPHRAEGGKCSMEYLPWGAVDAPFFKCMAVSVSVAELGALATDGLIRCAFVGVVVFKLVASETGDKFGVLLLLAL